METCDVYDILLFSFLSGMFMWRHPLWTATFIASVPRWSCPITRNPSDNSLLLSEKILNKLSQIGVWHITAPPPSTGISRHDSVCHKCFWSVWSVFFCFLVLQGELLTKESKRIMKKLYTITLLLASVLFSCGGGKGEVRKQKVSDGLWTFDVTKDDNPVLMIIKFREWWTPKT